MLYAALKGRSSTGRRRTWPRRGPSARTRTVGAVGQL